MPKPKKHLLSVIVPAYKQEKTIVKDLKRIEDVLKQLRYDYELICVVDGKQDKTYQNARKAKLTRAKIIGYQENRGKGYAVRYGMARTKGNLIAFIDAGMDIDPSGLPMLLEHMIWYDSDVIVGSIRHSASKVQDYPLERRILSVGYHTLTKILFGLRVTDSQRGIKIFKRKVLEKVLPRLLVKRYAFDIEILATSRRLGFTNIHDGPVILVGSGLLASSVGFGTIWSMLLDTMAVFYRLRLRRYYDDCNKRKWRLDPELNFKVNIG